MYSRLLILGNPYIANISLLETEIFFPFLYSNKGLASLFYTMNLCYCKPNFHSQALGTKIPQHNKLKALDTTENIFKYQTSNCLQSNIQV